MNPKVYRCIFIIINCLFKLMGFWFFGLGLGLKYGQNTKRFYEWNDTFGGGVKLMLALGSVLLILTMFGVYGAGRMKRCSLKMFVFLVILLIVAVIVIGILVQISGTGIVDFYKTLSNVYAHTGDRTTVITRSTIASLFHCCGMADSDTCSGLSQDSDTPACPMTSAKNLSIFIVTGILLFTALVCSFLLLRHINKSERKLQINKKPTKTIVQHVPTTYRVREERILTVQMT